MGTPNIILVEDDANVSLMLTRHLERSGCTVQVASTIARARELVRGPWDLMILDRNLPDGEGTDFCREVRAADPPAYIVMLTALDSDAAKLEGFACGADDYITKPAQMEELLARVRAGLRIVTLQKRLLQQSQTDPLTSLRNRRAFDEQLSQAFDQARRYERPLSLAIIDVDHFKTINDTSGHDAGDTVLRGIGHIIASRTRQSDCAARVGGEEFAVLLPETAFFEALQFGEKLRSAVAAEPIEGFDVRVSIGVASVPHSHAPNAAALFRAADQALYRAKNNGRNRVEIERRRASRSSEHPQRLSVVSASQA
jgi:two-component system cell cycle response regulator